MTSSRPLIALSLVATLAAIVASTVGLVARGGPGPRAFETVRGTTVELSGRGLYRHDTAFKAPILRGTDLVVLALAVPLTVVAVAFERRGSRRGRLLLVGALACLLYHAASDAFGVAYNALHLLYIAYFGASTFAFTLALATTDRTALAHAVSPRMPHRTLAVFLFVSALSACVWMLEIVTALVQGAAPPSVASYTTEATHVLDIGLIAPTAVYAGTLLWRKRPLGYPLAAALLALLAVIGFIVAGQTVMQVAAGIILTTGQIVAFVAPFLGLAVVAIAMLVALLRNIRET